MEYHTIYKGSEEESSQWDDVQRKLGNLPPKDAVWKPEAYTPEEETKRDESFLESKDIDELQELDDDFADDRFLEDYRRRRIEELQRGSALPRFGSLESIRGDEFVAQVTNAGDGIWVVCHLCKDSVGDCGILNTCLGDLAQRFPATKFLKIVSTDCIPGYPDENLPTMLLYRDTKCVATLVGLGEFGGRRGTSPDLVALTLNRYGPVCGVADNRTAFIKGMVEHILNRKENADGGTGDSDPD